MPAPAAPVSPWVQVFVGDDAALAAHLLAGLEGAEVKMRTLRCTTELAVVEAVVAEPQRVGDGGRA